MRFHTAIRDQTLPVEVPTRAFEPGVAEARWTPRFLLSGLRDRRSLAEIGGLSAYLSQIRWSLWWALRG